MLQSLVYSHNRRSKITYMQPVSPDSDNDHSQQPERSSDVASGETSSEITSDKAPDKPAEPSSSSSEYNRRWTDNPPVSPLENLQRRYTDQLSRDIEQLEAEKARLQAEIAALRQDHRQLRSTLPKASATAGELDSTAEQVPTAEISTTERVPVAERGPRLPGETAISPSPVVSAPARSPDQVGENNRSIELPTPATSEQRRLRIVRRRSHAQRLASTTVRRGLILSAIATLITAWHYGLVSTLHQGGSWLGFDIGQLGVGFVPAVALLWMRMLVVVPSLVLLAPQLHRTTWEDLLDWFYSREQLLIPLFGSGAALFFSQVFLYQSVGTAGPAIGTALLFLYPLSAVPLGLGFRQEEGLTPFGLLAVVAIAMGGFLVARPAFATSATAVWLGILASLTLSLYIGLTNRSYRLRCHPIPTAIVQFSTVAVLSSLVLLVKPLKLVSISWLSFCLWGLLIGILMLIAYLFTYASLLNIRSKTAIVAATTPVAALILGWSFSPRPPLQIIQWTGITLVTIGGIALGKEKLGKGPNSEAQ